MRMASLAEAREAAEWLAASIRPSCHRVEIAGSIRREKPTVKDVEIVCVPRWVERPGADLFGTPEPVNVLHDWAKTTNLARWIKLGTPEIIDWEPKADGKYWRGILWQHGDLKLDLFIARPENFGAIYLIRTGAADYSQAVVTHALRIGKRCVDGHFTVGGEPVPTPDETDVFKLLNLRYVEPARRTGPEALANG